MAQLEVLTKEIQLLKTEINALVDKTQDTNEYSPFTPALNAEELPEDFEPKYAGYRMDIDPTDPTVELDDILDLEDNTLLLASTPHNLMLLRDLLRQANVPHIMMAGYCKPLNQCSREEIEHFIKCKFGSDEPSKPELTVELMNTLEKLLVPLTTVETIVLKNWSAKEDDLNQEQFNKLLGLQHRQSFQDLIEDKQLDITTMTEQQWIELYTEWTDKA